MPDRWRALIRNPDGTLAGLIPGWSKLDLTTKYNDVGAIIVTLPLTDPSVQLLQPGSGIVVTRNGAPYISGPVETLHASMDPERDPWPGTLEVTCPDDLVWLRDRLVLPDPTHAIDDQAVNAYAVKTGPAETVARAYIAENALATAARPERVSILTQDPDQARGRTLTGYQLRFDNLLTAAQAILAPDGLGMRAVQGPEGPVLTIYGPTDRSGEVFFSYGRHNLVAFDLQQGIAPFNVEVVAGSGQGTSRAFLAESNTGSLTSWGRRVETFRDRRDTSDLTEMQQQADEDLAQSPDTLTVTFTPLDSDQATVFRDYGLGDVIAGEIGGVTFTQVVQQVQVTVDENGTVPTVTAGALGAAPPLPLARTLALLKQLNTRVAGIERRQ